MYLFNERVGVLKIHLFTKMIQLLELSQSQILNCLDDKKPRKTMF